MKFLLDTNTVSELLRSPTGAVAASAARVDGLCTNVVVACEVAFGLRRREGKRIDVLRAQWEALKSTIPVLEIDDSVVDHYAAVRMSLEAAGSPIGSNDLLIAAHALSMGAVVVTNNIREFSRVPGLQIENWLTPVPAGEAGR
jgi:tRNA(fMet)-specific endonuclease VapC